MDDEGSEPRAPPQPVRWIRAQGADSKGVRWGGEWEGMGQSDGNNDGGKEGLAGGKSSVANSFLASTGAYGGGSRSPPKTRVEGKATDFDWAGLVGGEGKRMVLEGREVVLEEFVVGRMGPNSSSAKGRARQRGEASATTTGAGEESSGDMDGEEGRDGGKNCQSGGAAVRRSSSSEKKILRRGDGRASSARRSPRSRSQVTAGVEPNTSSLFAIHLLDCLVISFTLLLLQLPCTRYMALRLLALPTLMDDGRVP